MNTFNKIIVDSEINDVVINEGDNLNIGGGSCSIQGGLLKVMGFDDVIMTVPHNHYLEIKITTTCGDCVINFNESLIEKVAFESESGDLVVNGQCNNVSFNSHDGYCITKTPLLNKKSQGKTVKERSNYDL